MGIKTVTAAMSDPQMKKVTRKLLEAALVDLAALRVTIAALQVDFAARLANHNTLRVKLNADEGVTGTDYAAGTAATASAPAALTLKE